MNRVTSPLARTAIQGAAAELVLRGAEVLPDPDLVFAGNDRSALAVVVLAAICGVMNLVEARLGRKLLAPKAETPATSAAAPPPPTPNPGTPAPSA